MNTVMRIMRLGVSEQSLQYFQCKEARNWAAKKKQEKINKIVHKRVRLHAYTTDRLHSSQDD